MTGTRQPLTAAGRAFVAHVYGMDMDDVLPGILAIEAEAAAPQPPTDPGGADIWEHGYRTGLAIGICGLCDQTMPRRELREHYEEHERRQDFSVSSDMVIALAREAAAPQPGERERALEAALESLLADEFCPCTTGGTEGPWCINHDTPMGDGDECWKVLGARAALAHQQPTEGGQE